MIVFAHLGCGVLLVTGLGLVAALWALALYVVRMLAITAIYHRLITHRSYQAPRLVWWLGTLVAASSAQMGPSWWTAHHRQHHRHVDTADPHTPLLPIGGWRGFWRSQLGWLLGSSFHPHSLPLEVEADPVLRGIDRLHVLPPLGLAVLSWWLGGAEWLGAFCLSTTLLFHGVASVNSFAHLFGHQPFTSADASRNNGWVALITLGEGWHNLHHAFQGSVRQGYTVVENTVVTLPDPTYSFIQLLERAGWATRLRLPSKRALLARAAIPHQA